MKIVEEGSLNMANYREIITKAVTGKGRKFTQSSHTLTPPNKPTSILGCWVINQQYKARKRGNLVEVDGTYDINTWYSYDDNTKTEVVTEETSYKDTIRLRYRDAEQINDEECDVIVRVLQQPNCLEATISPKGHKVLVQVERELLAEVVGETKLVVAVNPDGLEDDDFDLDVDDEEFEDLDPDFILGDEE